LILSLTDVVAQVLSLVLIMVVARRLGPSLMGVYAFGQTFIGMFDIFVAFGLTSYILRTIGRSPESAPALLGDVILLKAAVFGACLLVILALLPFVAAESPKREVVLIMTATMYFRSNMSAICTFFRARQMAQYEAAIRLGFRLFYTAAGVAALLIGYGLIALVALDAAAMAGAFLLSGIVFTAKIGRPRFKASLSRVVGLMRKTWNFFLVKIVQTIFNSFDMIMLSLMSGDVYTGYYSSTVRLGLQGLDFIPGAFDGAYMPVLSREAAVSRAGFLEVFSGYFRILVLLGVGLGAALGGFAPSIMELVFGPDFLPAAPTMMVIAGALTLIFANWPLSNAILALDRERLILRAFAICAAANIGLNLWAIPQWQDLGAAAATVASLALLFVIQCKILGREVLAGMRLWRLSRRSILCGLITLGIIYALNQTGWPFVWRFLPAAVAFWLLAAATGSVTKADLDEIRALIRNRRKKGEEAA
jgi:O-antigen/teichoic acid export membrane protein